ncbi:hypothetical protein ACA910_003895 [Epithemia clementina (nom. ined.)]
MGRSPVSSSFPLVLAAIVLSLVVGIWVSILVVSSFQHQSERFAITPPRLSYAYSNKTNDADKNERVLAFTILQLADLHLGEAQNSEFGPEQDRKTWHALHSYLERTASFVDLIVLSGDQLTANDCYNPRKNCTLYYIQLGQHLAEYNIPFAVIFGNHDDMATEKTHFVSTTRQELVQTLQQHFPGLSLVQQGPANVTGVSNYWVDLYFPGDDNNDGLVNKNNNNKNKADTHAGSEVASRIAFLDTGGGQLDQRIDNTHLQWFMQENNNKEVDVVAFAHIPTKEFQYINDQQCVGINGDNSVAPPKDGDVGLIQTLSSQANVHFLAVGHDHGNDYCCPLQQGQSDDNGNNKGDGAERQLPEGAANINASPLHLCFGRHSGYGGYGTWDRGARLYELQLLRTNGELSALNKTTMFRWKSWVLMESGTIRDEYNPYNI